MRDSGHPVTESLDLVRRAQDGDRAALNDLFSRYYKRVLKIVRLRMGAGLRERLESVDIMQDTFASAVSHFDQFEVRRESSFLWWLTKIAENRIRHQVGYHSAAKRDRRRTTELDSRGQMLDSADSALEPVAHDPLPVDELAGREETEIVEACLGELHPEQRELVLLRDYIGGRWSEIAEWLELSSPDQARRRYSRALDRLGELVSRRTSD